MIKTNVSQTNTEPLYRTSSVGFYFISCYCKVMVSPSRLIFLMALTSHIFHLLMEELPIQEVAMRMNLRKSR